MSSVNIKVNADTGRARRELGKLENSVDSIAKTANKVNSAFNAIATGIAVALGTDAITKASDSYIELENRVALVTGRTKELTKTLDELYRVSASSRGSIETSVETFNRFGRALDGTVTSTEDLVQVTSTVQKALAISGGNAQSASAAIFQLGQGLASGQLRGQELNSVLEQAPRIAEAIADSMGVAMGALRGLAEEGQLTTAVVFEALKSQAGAIGDEFLLTNNTVGKSLIVLFDQVKRVIGKFNSSTLAISSGAFGFEALSTFLDKNADLIALKGAYIFNRLTNATVGFVQIAKGVFSIFSAIIGRVIDALPRLIIPMRTLTDDIFVGLIYGTSLLGTNLFNLVGQFDSFVSSVLGIGFEGTIFRIFNAKSLIEFGYALQDLGTSISTYGARWYNVGNLAERAIRQLNFSLVNTGIYLGLVDQKLLAFRYTSFERFYNVLKPIGILLKDILLSFVGMEFLASGIAVITIVFQELFAVIDAGLNVIGLSTRKILGFFGDLQDLVEDINPFDKGSIEKTVGTLGDIIGVSAQQILDTGIAVNKVWGGLMDDINRKTGFLSKTGDFVKKFAVKVERAFFWLYDEIIGNSWWTDTMEGVYDKAKINLTKTATFIGQFYNTVIAAFKRGKEKITDISVGIKVFLENKSLEEIGIAVLDTVKGVATSVIGLISEIIAEGYNRLAGTLPRVAEGLAVGFTAAILAILSPVLFAKVGISFGIGLVSSISNGLAQSMGTAIVGSSFFTSLGAGLGRGAGQFVNAIIQNIPLILTAFIDLSKAFGAAFIEEIKGAFGIIPGLLSDLTGGLFDTLLGAFLTVFAASSLTRGFSKTIKSVTSLFGASSAGKGGLMASLLFGKNNSSARLIAGVVGVLTTVNSLFGGFTEGGALGEVLISGGLLAYTVFGSEGISAILSKVKGFLGTLVSSVTSSASKLDTVGLGKSLNLGGITASVKSGDFNNAFKQAGASIDGFKRQVNSGKFSKTFRDGIASMQQSVTSTFTGPAFTNSFGSAFSNLGKSMGDNLAKGFKGSKYLGIAALIGGLVLAAGSADAATASTGAKVDGMVEAVSSNIKEIAFGGLMTLALFGPDTIIGWLGKAGGAILSAGKYLVGFVNIAALTKFKDFGLMGLTMFGKTGKPGALLGVIKKVMTSSLSKIVFGGLLSVGARIGAFFLGLFSLPGLLLAGTVGLIGVMLFGKGDGFLAKLSNVGSSIRSFFTGTTLAARDMARELKPLLADLDSIGGQEIQVQELVGSLDLSMVSDNNFRKLELSLKSLNAVAERNNASFEENGENSRLESEQQVRAIRDVETAVYNSRVPENGLPDLTSVFTELFKPESFKDGGIFGFGGTSPINKVDTTDLFGLAFRISEGTAAQGESSEYLRKLLDFFNTEGITVEGTTFEPLQGGEGLNAAMSGQISTTGQIEDLTQKAARDTLRAILPVLDIQEDLQVPASLIAIFKEQAAIVEGIASNIGGEDSEGSAVNNSQALEGSLSTLNAIAIAIRQFNDNSTAATELEDSFKSYTDLASVAQQFGKDIPSITADQFASASDDVRENLFSAVALAEDALKRGAFDKIVDDYAGFNNSLARAVREIGMDAFEDGIVPEDARIPLAVFDAISSSLNSAISEGISPENIPDLASFINFESFSQAVNAMDSLIAAMVTRSEGRFVSMSVRVRAALNSIPLELAEGMADAVDVNLLNSSNVSAIERFAREINLAMTSNIDPISKQLRLDRLALGLNEALSETVSTVSMINASLSLVDDPISELDLYEKDEETRVKIATLTASLLGLQTVISTLGVDGISEGEIDPLVKFLSEYEDKLTELNGIVGNASGSSGAGEAVKTQMEQLMADLSQTNFNFNLTELSQFSTDSLKALSSEASNYADAQERLNDLAFTEVDARKSALDVLKQSKDAISDIISTTNFGGLDEILGASGSSLNISDLISAGLDSSEIDSYLSNAIRIREIQEEITQLGVDQLDEARTLNTELEKRIGIEDSLGESLDKSLSKYDNIKSTFSDLLSGGLKDLDKFKTFFGDLLDSITTNIIDSVVDAFTEALFESLNLKDTFAGLFEGLFDFGDSIGKSTGEAITTTLSGVVQEDGAGIVSSFGDIFSGISDFLGGLFGGGGGGGGGGFLSSIFGLFSGGSLLNGLNNGGFVKPLGTTRTDRDSVPAMLTPGELVIPADKVGEFTSPRGGSGQTFNINVSGDVSRQTRKEIVQMLPQIAAGVNSQNKENNYRR
jgi:tape measure domain-containing protein